MAPTPGQSTSKRLISAQEWNKMSRGEKREFFRKQRLLARVRKPQGEASEGAEIIMDSSTTVDTTTISDQNPTATLSQPDDRGSVSSAPGHGVEESKEESLEDDIAISIKSSKFTSSSQYSSHANEFAFL